MLLVITLLLSALAPVALPSGVLVVVTTVPDPTITALVRPEDLSPEDRERLFEPREGNACHLFSPPASRVITDRRSRIERLLHRSIPLGPLGQ